MGLKSFIWIRLRIWKYKLLSSLSITQGAFIIHQPILLNGEGKVTVGNEVHIGVVRSPYYYNGYGYIEARTVESSIAIGNNVHINNNCSIVSEKSKIIIEDDVLIGYNCHIYDSDFHELNSYNRLLSQGKTAPVRIRKNVFIGNNVTVLKGVEIGENAVIGSNTVVSSNVPANTVVVGNPMKMISKLDFFEKNNGS